MTTDTPSVAQHKVADNLRKIADASKRGDGSDIPLGAQCREAADLIETLTSPVEGVTTIDELMESIVLSVVPGTKGQHHVIDYLPARDAIAAHIATLNAALAAEKARARSWETMCEQVDRNRQHIESRLATSEAARVKAEAALKAVEPYLDAIVCYASTIDEHDGNRVAVLVRTALGETP